MGKPIITVEGLGKAYRIGLSRKRPDTLHEFIADASDSAVAQKHGGAAKTLD